MPQEENMTASAARMMLDAMKKLSAKEITPQEAQGVAMLGKGVIDAAQAEINFIKTCKALPQGGMFGKNMIFLEPECDDVALHEQTRRLSREKR